MIHASQPNFGPAALPGVKLRAPKQLLSAVSTALPPSSGDRLSLSAVSSQLAAWSGNVFAAPTTKAAPKTAPQAAPKTMTGSEARSFAGVAATIHWGQRYTQPKGSGRVPSGYSTIKGTLPQGLSQAATAILKQGNPLGTYTPFSLGGKHYVALNEYHTHYASRPNDPPDQIYAITVFARS